MTILSSLAIACTITGALAGMIVFALLIVVVEHAQGGATGAGPAGTRTAYVPSTAFLVASRRAVWRVIVCGAVGGALLFAVGLGLLLIG